MYVCPPRLQPGPSGFLGFSPPTLGYHASTSASRGKLNDWYDFGINLSPRLLAALNSLRLFRSVLSLQWISRHVSPSASNPARPTGHPIHLPFSCFQQLVRSFRGFRQSESRELPAAVGGSHPQGHPYRQPPHRDDPDQPAHVYLAGLDAACSASMVRSTFLLANRHFSGS